MGSCLHPKSHTERQSTELKNNEFFCKFIGGTLQLTGIERQLEDLCERGKEW